MKRKYNCFKCGKENIVDFLEVTGNLKDGFGNSGVMAGELNDLGAMLSNSTPFLGGFFSKSPRPKILSHKHTCEHCGETNILNI
jgi:hypothetical protein